MFRGKRGITPLIATVLLVVFSIGLGAVVMSWGEDYIEQKAEFVQGTAEIKSQCDLAEFNVIKIAGSPQACTQDGAIQLWIDNGPEVDISNIHARILTEETAEVVDDILLAPLERANAARAVIPYSGGYVRQLKLTPKVWTGQTVTMCSQSAIKVENLNECL